MPIPSAKGPDGSTEMPIQGVFPVDISTDPTTYTMPCTIRDTITNRQARIGILGGSSESFGFSVLDINSLVNYGNFPGGAMEYARTPTTFKTIGLTIAAGDTALWVPAGAKKFRLMGIVVDIAAGTTAAAACLLQLRDQATVIANHTICGGALAASAGRKLVDHVFPGNGYLSQAADNTLFVNLSSVLAAGGITAFAYGTEE